MQIFKSVKKTSAKFLLNYHPKVSSLKEAAKNLFNTQNKSMSFWECQDIVAKSEGFENWNHFIKVIENQSLDADLDKSLCLTTTPITDKHNDVILGFDIMYQKYLWMHSKEFFLHNLILGSDLNSSYDLFLISQLIEKKEPIYYLNPSSKEEIEKIISFAKSLNLEKNIRVFNFSEQRLFVGYEYKINNTLEQTIANQEDLSFIENILKEGFQLYHETSGLWESRFFLLYRCVVEILQNLKQNKNFNYNINTIQKALKIENLLKIYFQENALTGELGKIFNNYMETLPQFNRQSLEENLTNKVLNEQHSYLIRHFNLFVENFHDNPVFDSKGVNIFDIFGDNKEYINIFYFGQTDKSHYYQRLICFLLQNQIHKDMNERKYKTDHYFLNKKFVFLNDCFLPKHFSVIGAQSRISNISITYSYKNYFNLKQKLSNDGMSSLFANVFNFFISQKEVQNLSKHLSLNIGELPKEHIDNSLLFHKIGKTFLLTLRK